MICTFFGHRQMQKEIEPILRSTLIDLIENHIAILYRNKWMIQHADYVVTYVVNPIGSGAAQFKALAERRGKKVIELADL